jgi:hypothetical protein
VSDRNKEQIKLRANALDRASTACLTVGVLAPFAASLYTGGNNADGWKLLIATILYLGIALLLHHLALSVLEDLE